MPKTKKPGVRALNAALKDYDTRLAAAQKLVTEQADEIERLTDNVDFWKGQFRSQKEAATELDRRRQHYEIERDASRSRADREREARLRAEAELKETRGYIEGLLDGLHPARPELPWERLDRITVSGEQIKPHFDDWSQP